MQFDKRLWLARWAGDEERVRELAERLGGDAQKAGDVVLQENLFEAQLTSAASEALYRSGINAALEAVKVETSKRPHHRGDRSAEALATVSGRIEKRLRTLERQLRFKERHSGKRTEFFLEQRRETQHSGRTSGGRFFRIAHHPHGVEVRSYLFTSVWVDPARAVTALESAGVEVLERAQRATMVGINGERLVVHADGRIHAVLRSRDVKAAIETIAAVSSAIDQLWQS